MINPPLERLTQAMHDVNETFVPAGRLQADDVRAVVDETRRLRSRVKDLERALAAEVGLREAARRNLEQASVAWSRSSAAPARV